MISLLAVLSYFYKNRQVLNPHNHKLAYFTDPKPIIRRPILPYNLAFCLGKCVQLTWVLCMSSVYVHKWKSEDYFDFPSFSDWPKKIGTYG